MSKSKNIEQINNALSLMFEKEYVRFSQNATTSIWALLKSLGLADKKIVIPANICFVVPCAIVLSGNKPHFVDIDDGYSASLKELEKINDDNVGAVIYPYNYGNVGELDKLISIAKKREWVLIEDTAQALGAEFNGRYVGSFSDYAVTSFGEGKIVDVGRGGCIAVNDARLHQEITSLISTLKPCSILSDSLYASFNRFYYNLLESMESDEDISLFGEPLSYSFKEGLLSEENMQPLLVHCLLNELKDLDKHVEIRNVNAAYFRDLIKIDSVKVIEHSPGSVYWRQNLLVPPEIRDDLVLFLRNKGIKVSKYFPSIDRMFYRRSDKSGFVRSDQMYSGLVNLWPGHHTTYKDILNISMQMDAYFN